MFHGSIVALITPMKSEGEIDYACVDELLEFHLCNNTDGIVLVGTTGESGTLSESEQHKLVHYVVKRVNSKLPVIVGTGSVSTTKTIHLSIEAMELGADGCLIMSPPYVKPTQEGLYQHYKAIAKAIPTPIIVYNIPGRTACDILPETMQKLAEFSNIIGIKEASGSLERVQQLLKLCGDKLNIYSGEDLLAKDIMLVGGKGVISVTANIAPKQMHELCEVALAGKKDAADELDRKLQPLHKAMFLESNPIPVKWAAHQMGLVPPGIRLPLTPLSEKYQQQVREAMTNAGIKTK